jgi:hypothetical protein
MIKNLTLTENRRRMSWFLWFLMAIHLFAQGLSRAETEMSTSSYTVGTTHRVLSLLEVPIAQLGDARQLEFFHLHPEMTSFPNAALILTDEDEGQPSSRHVVWIQYAYIDRTIRPAQIWDAAIASPVHEDEAYVVVSKSASWDVTLSIYRVDLRNSSIAFPVTLAPERFDEWPKPSPPPVSTMRKKLVDKDVSGVRHIKAGIRDGEIHIECEREQPSTPTVKFVFSPKSGTWSQSKPEAPQK